MYCFSFFRNQLWQHLISYNSFRNVNMCLLEVAMCEKRRSSHFQSEGGVRSLRTRGVKKFQDWVGVTDFRGGGTFAEGFSTPLNAMITNPTLITAFDTYLTPRSPGAWQHDWGLNQDHSNSECGTIIHFSKGLAHK